MATRYRSFAWLLLACNALYAEHPFVPGFERLRNDRLTHPRTAELLISELNCAQCHLDLGEPARSKGAPLLTGVGRRLQADWIRRFLLNPQKTKPGTTMPMLFASLPEPQRREHAEDLVHFLMAQQQKLYPPLPTTRDEDLTQSSAERGRVVYHEVGCVACHEPEGGLKEDTPEDDGKVRPRVQGDLVDSVPHPQLQHKYTHASLTSFLLNPLLVRRGGRMPAMKLSFLEAADVAAYLSQQAIAKTFKPESARVARGRKLYVSARCIQCHELEGHSISTVNIPLKTITSGCLQASASTSKEAPRFSLKPSQIAELQASVRRRNAGQPNSGKVGLPDTVTLTMARFNCIACHERMLQDGKAWGGVGRRRREHFETIRNIDIGDEGRIPPPLTGVGAKLKSKWIERVLEGKGDVRPHMLTRMPKFGVSHVRQLAGQFTKLDQNESKTSTAKVAFPGKGDVDAGRLLMSKGCIQCHALKGQRMPGVVGIDLTNLDERIQPQWFRELVLDPNSKRPRTRMPNFFPNKKASVKDVLNGDVEKQLASLWEYLAKSDKLPVPEVLASSNSATFELVPKDRPIVMRTFFEGAGNRAVVVGLPGGVHLAFDAEKLQLAVAWHGRFLDAHATWFDRFTPPTKPLGKGKLQFPGGAIRTGSTSPEKRWIGYRLNKKGLPTLLYEWDRLRVQETVDCPAPKRLVRRIKIQADTPQTLSGFACADDAKAQVSEDGKKLQLSNPRLDIHLRTAGQIQRSLKDRWEVVLDGKAQKEYEIVLEYQWK